MKARSLFCLLVLAVTVNVGYAQEKVSVTPYLELIRSDIRADKVAIITENMQLSEDEASAFWPLYRKYELELSNIWDERLELIKDYAANYETMTNEKAHDLMKSAFKIEDKKSKMERKYYYQMEKAVSSKVAARFQMLENRLGMLIDLQIASELPLVK